MMVASGWMVGAFFCALGTLALIAIAVVALRWALDQGQPGGPSPVSSLHGPSAERLD